MSGQIDISSVRILELIQAVAIAPDKLAHVDNYAAVKKQVLRARGIVVHHMAGTLSGTTTWFQMGRAQRQEANERLWKAQKMKGTAPKAFVSSAHAGVGGVRRTDGSVDVHTYVPSWWKAYHAGGALKPVKGGAPIMQHGANPNDFMIGIEHETNAKDYAAQMNTSAVLIVAYAHAHRFDIDESTIVLHSALARTACPGAVNVSTLIARATVVRSTFLANSSFKAELDNSQRRVQQALAQM